VRISIPAIGVRAPVNPVGLAEDGSIATPSLQRKNEAGWYERGPTPGQYGPAIIVGHVDGTKGPAVFHKLGTLRPGQLIEVVRRDRRVAIFQVDEVATYDKASLPTKKIYGDFSRPGLRVITCGGQWVGGDLGYAENVVVFASLVRTRKT
jgi:sortase (surface protein transpeptidase)